MKIQTNIYLPAVRLGLDSRGYVRETFPLSAQLHSQWLGRKITNAATIAPGDYALFRGRRGIYHINARSDEKVTKVERIEKPAKPEQVQSLKYVRSGGLRWLILSRNEREVTVNGRTFFAVRCDSKLDWTIIEYDRSVYDVGGARELRRWKIVPLKTKDLTFKVLELADALGSIKRKGDPLEKFREEIRARGQKVNPWRLGRAVAEAGEEIRNPYDRISQRVGHNAYNDGMRVGFLRRHRRSTP